jgi:hypothetical protein
MKAYLIDPVARTVTDIEVDDSNDQAMLVSLRTHMQCQWLEAVRLRDALRWPVRHPNEEFNFFRIRRER